MRQSRVILTFDVSYKKLKLEIYENAPTCCVFEIIFSPENHPSYSALFLMLPKLYRLSERCGWFSADVFRPPEGVLFEYIFRRTQNLWKFTRFGWCVFKTKKVFKCTIMVSPKSKCSYNVKSYKTCTKFLHEICF